MIGQIEEELRFLLPFLRSTDDVVYEFSKFDVKYLEE